MSEANDADNAVSEANDADNAVSEANDTDNAVSEANDTDNAVSEANEQATTRPVLRILRGDPTREEVAALTAVLASASGGDEPVGTGPRSVWAERTRLVRRPVHPGPGGWRASALPG